MECDIAGIRPSVSYYLQAFSSPVRAEGSNTSERGNLSSAWLRNPYHIPSPNFSPKLHISKFLATACGKALLLRSSKVDSDMEDLMTMNDMTVVEAQASDTPGTTETEKKEDTATATKQSPMTPPQSERFSHQPRAQSLSVTVPKPQSHMRAQSIATSSPARKRLSLSFPVLPPGCEPPSRNRSPTSGTVTPQTLFPAEIDPDDSAAFLTALAAQERRVLELREELSKAESELTKLKRQWAIHEAKKTRREMALGSSVLTSPTRRGDPRDSLTSPTTREDFERRRKPTTGAGRKVLSSQRHTRTLSLLSPERQQQPDTPTMDQDHSQLVEGHALMNSPSVKESSSSTSPLRTQSLDLPTTRPKNQDVLLKTGKQMAEDFRDGLWNFIEDLKQATVGEDIMRPPPIRRIPSRSNLRQPSTSTITSLRNATKSKGKEREDDLIDLGQDEENQNFRWSTSTTLSDPSGVTTPPSRASTPRTSTRFVPSSFPQRWVALMLQKDWQAEEKPVDNSSVTSLLTYTPSQIKKHATTLMTQMEKTFEIERVEDQKGGGTLGRSNSCSLKGEPGGELRSRSGSPKQRTE
jgi:hypothetical protein